VLTPMMLSFIVSSIIGGQLIARTGRYKPLALTGLAIASAGMLLLSRMNTQTTEAVVVRNMVITGLGMGGMMSIFTIVVQNAFPFRMLGQVTASLQFFRSIGGTIGVAVLGTVMSTTFRHHLQRTLPPELAQVMPLERLAQIQNPQALLLPEATQRLQQSFATLGPQGQALFTQVLQALRLSLDMAITQVFTVGTVALVLAWGIVLLLPEVPLRRSHKEPVQQESGSEALAFDGPAAAL
jgi:MFS family permease